MMSVFPAVVGRVSVTTTWGAPVSEVEAVWTTIGVTRVVVWPWLPPPPEESEASSPEGRLPINRSWQEVSARASRNASEAREAPRKRVLDGEVIRRIRTATSIECSGGGSSQECVSADRL